MKKLSTLLIIAFAMVLGLTQCKKKVDTIATSSDLGKTVHITVNVGGDKHQVFPNTGAVVYTDGDVIYVGNGGKYIGTLTYGSGAFSGDIYSPSTADYLHFYFVGGLTPSATPVAGTTANFTVNIADQSGILPVLSYGRSTVKYTDASTTYGCTLLNKCALVEFTLTDGTNTAVSVGGMNTGATINFNDTENAIVANGTTGAITLRNVGNNSERWAILLPQDAVDDAAVTIGGDDFTVDVPAITANGYLHGGTAVAINPAPAFDPVFSVSSTKTVHFSPGNLQYKSGEGWRFAPNQWNVCQNDGTWDTSDWVDLFGWGTWGQGKYPLNTSTDYVDYEWSTDFQGTLGGHNDWYTPSTEEWQHLFSSRTNASSLYGSATVNSVHGIVVLPDNWTLPTGSSFTAGMSGWDNNTYDVSAWATMEEAGAVFLPAAGERNGSSVDYAGSYGNYWSSTYNDSYNAYYMYFSARNLYPQDSYDRYYGLSVRLVF